MNHIYSRSRCLMLALLLPFLLASCAGEAKTDGDKEQPNFLLIVADDMAYTDAGSFGGEIQTPNLDTLGARGVKFSNFHVSVSCSPTRSMLLSGTDNHLAGMGNMDELLTPEQRGKPGYEGHLNRRVVSLPEVLRDAGYHTYMAGKWHLGHEPEYFPHARGFERSFSLLFGGASHWDDMTGLIEAQTPAMYTMNGEQLHALSADFYSTRSYSDFLMDSIRENRGGGRPFLAYLAFTSPHDPLHVPEPWLSKYRGQYDDGYEALQEKRAEGAKRRGLVPPNVTTPDRHVLTKPWDSLSDRDKVLESRKMEVYAGMVDNLDHHLGRVIRFLKDIGEYDNTVIIFMSDNGPNPWVTEDYPGNRGSNFLRQFDDRVQNIGNPGSAVAYGIGWATAGSGPYHYFKMTVGEGGIRSPMIVAGPGVDGPGRTIESFGYVTDIMPTMLELAGVEHPVEYEGRKVLPMRGRSMAGLLSGAADHIYEPDEFVGGEMGGGRWMRQGDYKAVMLAEPYGPAVWQVYNLAEDPGETRDLADEKSELLQDLKAAWDHYAEDVGVVLPK